MTFDTSGIGSTSTITSSTLIVRGSLKYNECNIATLNWNVYAFTGTATTTFVAADYASSTHGITAFSSNISHTNWSTTADNVFLLNASGLANISKTNYSKFSFRNVDYDVANTAPPSCGLADYNQITFYRSADALTDIPRLVVEYSAPAEEALPRIRPVYIIGLINKAFAK